MRNWLVVIPARLRSERLPEKPLAELGGVPMIVRVHQNLAPLAAKGATLVVATDAESVRAACAKHGVTAVMTDVAHQSGTDRCAEVARAHAGAHRFIMNVQGDEPFVDTGDLLRLAAEFEARAAADIGTLCFRATDPVLAGDPNVVKAVTTHDGWALYFSRSTLPYDRDAKDHKPAAFWQHMGVYAFRREKLLAFVALGGSPLEKTEKLEQLRALEHGWKIHVTAARSFSRGIDTREDLEAARARLK